MEWVARVGHDEGCPPVLVRAEARVAVRVRHCLHRGAETLEHPREKLHRRDTQDGSVSETEKAE